MSAWPAIEVGWGRDFIRPFDRRFEGIKCDTIRGWFEWFDHRRIKSGCGHDLRIDVDFGLSQHQLHQRVLRSGERGLGKAVDRDKSEPQK